MTRPMVTVGVPFLTFILAVSFFTRNVTLGIILGLIIIMILTVLFANKKHRIQILAVVGAAFLACIRWAGYQTVHSFDFNTLEGKTCRISGVIKDMKSTSSSRTAYTVRIQSHNIKNAPDKFTAILYANGNQECGLYDMISGNAKCMAMSKTPTFNLKQYYSSQGIDLILSSYKKISVDKTEKKPFMYYAKTLNQELCARVDNMLSEPYSGLVKAMLLGNDDTMDEMIYHKFVRAGVTHIFVVSGLHVSLIAGLAVLLLKKFGVSSRVRAVITGVVVWGFAALTGFAVPVVRAGIMLSVMLLATVFRRPADTLNSLFLAGVIIILVNPAAIMGGSFQLTFTATLGAVILARPITEWIILKLHIKNKILKLMISVIGMTLACNLAMFPVILILFRGISLVSVIENIIVIPLLPVILISAVLMLLCFHIPIAAIICEKFIEMLLNIVIKTSEVFGGMRFAYLGLNYRFVFIWMVLVLVLIAAAFFVAKNRDLAVRLCCVMIAGFTMLLCVQKYCSRNIIEITAVESFGAQGVAIFNDNVNIVVSLSDDKYLDKEMETFLRSKNVRYINDFVLGYPSTEYVSDTEFLTASIPTYNLILYDTDEFFPYADEILPLKGEVYPLKEGKGFHLFESDEVTIDVQRAFDGVLVIIQAGSTEIAVTNSESLIQDVNCEILFCCEKNIEIAEQNQARYVILLDEPQKKPEKFSKQYFAAYENEVSVRVRKNGSYMLRG